MFKYIKDLIGEKPSDYCYCVQWLFADTNDGMQEKTFPDIQTASNCLMGLLPEIKRLAHVSITRRNA